MCDTHARGSVRLLVAEWNTVLRIRVPEAYDVAYLQDRIWAAANA